VKILSSEQLLQTDSRALSAVPEIKIFVSAAFLRRAGITKSIL
jgi:hypothetical protein